MPENFSMGYPNVEKLIDTEDFGELNQTFESIYKELDEISNKNKGLRTSREARKVMKAVEQITDLLKELLAVKYKLQEMLKKEGQGPKGQGPKSQKPSKN